MEGKTSPFLCYGSFITLRALMGKIVSVISSAYPFLGAGDSPVSFFGLASLVQVIPSLLIRSSTIVLVESSLLVPRCRQLLGSFTVTHVTGDRTGDCRRIYPPERLRIVLLAWSWSQHPTQSTPVKLGYLKPNFLCKLIASAGVQPAKSKCRELGAIKIIRNDEYNGIWT